MILSAIVFLLAITILAPVFYGGLTLAWLVGLAFILMGFVTVARATRGMIVVGIIAVIVGFVVLVYPPLGGATAVLLLALALIIFGLELITADLLGRWMYHPHPFFFVWPRL
ncbi:MAG: hypothetical protein WCB91_12170 [Halobacteriota archaeon]